MKQHAHLFGNTPGWRNALLVVSLLVAGGVAGPANAAITYEVDRFDDDASADDCLVAANDCSLRGAIIKGNSDGQMTTIELPDGTYLLTIPGNSEDLGFTGDLDIREALEINAAANASPVIEQTVADRVFETFGGIGPLTIRGPMTIKGGNVSSLVGASGGLINAFRNGSVTLEDVALVGGEAATFGGCLAFTNPTVSGSLSLTNVTISGCSAGERGGGLWAQIGDSSATFDRLVVEDNAAAEAGGGAFITSSSTTVLFIESTIEGNVAEDPVSGSGSGGGIYFGDARARIERSTVARNRAGVTTGFNGYGGGIDLWTSDLTLRNSTVSGNVVEGASNLGTAIHLRSDGNTSSLLVDQSTIVGDPTSSLTWSAVGIFANGTVTFEGSIVEGGCHIHSTGTFTSNGFNVERPIDGAVTTQCGLNNPSDVLTSSPFLRPLAGYGGPTRTHALMAGAPAIFLVSSGSCRATDQRLAPRVFLFCDAGSYESSGQAPGMWIFSDGFESGTSLAWSGTTP
jgi:hypothetical protein